MSEPLFSVVLPVYNQADHIEEVLNGYLAALDKGGVDAELLPVINGPRRDNSLEVCQAVAARDPRVRPLLTEKGGWGHAVRFGLSQAKGRQLCYTNSARTTPQELLLILLYAKAHSDVVIKANRKIRESFKRRFGSVLYNFECRTLFDLAVWDVNGTPKAFPREFTKLVNLQREDDLIDLEFNVHCRRENYPILEVPILSSTRHGGKSTTSLNSAWKMYLGAWQMKQRFPK